MKLFIYELVSAGALGPDTPVSLRREGRAMLSALTADFGALPGVAVTTLVAPEEPDDALADEAATFREMARASDFCLIVAPEFDDWLALRSEWAAAEGARLLGPPPAAIRAASDKANLAGVLVQCGIATPPIVARLDADNRPDPGTFAYPLIIKPRFGAGCLGVQRVDSPADFAASLEHARAAARYAELLLQPLLPGLAASAAFLVGESGIVPLRAGRQMIRTVGGQLSYTGGVLPLPPGLERRALALGASAVGAFPGLRGFVGVDLVLDDANDAVIEINPRVTTAYVGLRRLGQSNLADLWLRLVRGGAASAPRWRNGCLAFGSDGNMEGYRMRPENDHE